MAGGWWGWDTLGTYWGCFLHLVLCPGPTHPCLSVREGLWNIGRTKCCCFEICVIIYERSCGELSPTLGFPGDSAVKYLPAVQELQEMWVRSLGWEDPLEEGMTTHSSIRAWRIPWIEKPGRLQATESQKSWTQLSDETTTTTITCLSCSIWRNP